MAEGDANRVWVAVRRRPFNHKERSEGEADQLLVECSGNTVFVKASDRSDVELEHHFEDKSFGYDHVFDGCATQEEVYDAIGEPLVENAMNAYNGCVFAYGQTSSGKTHSVVGDLTSEAGWGIQPRACMRLFELLEARKKANESFQAQILATYMEIYNEKIFDLLSGGQDSKDELHVRLHPSLGPIVANLTECPIQNFADAIELFDYGAKRRAVGATQMNETSSRSHAIFTVQIRTSVRISGGTTESQAKIHFVDLAGSERQKKTQATGARLREGIGINQSLSTLSRVISDLSAKGSKALPPFRESKLTLLLKDALMGNSRTALLACVSPAKSNLAETVGTLEFAARCKLVKTRARKNEESRADVIQKLTLEKEAIESQLLLEKATSENLCKQLQAEIEKVEQSEKSAEEAISAKREIEEKLRDLEAEHANLAQALQERSEQDGVSKEKAQRRLTQPRQSVLREHLAQQISALEERKQLEIVRLEERKQLEMKTLEERKQLEIERTAQDLRAKLEEERQAQMVREQKFAQEIEGLKAFQESWAVDQQQMEAKREEQHQHREAELQRLGMHLTDIDSKDLALAPRLVNLHPDPALKGCLVYYLPIGESIIGSDEERCRVRLVGPGICPKVCVIANVDNANLSVKPVDAHVLVRINGAQVEMEGKALADGDRVAVGRAAIFQVHIPTKARDSVTAEEILNFDAAMEEIAACAQVDPHWENGLRKAMQLVRSDYGDEAAKTLLEQAKRASETIGTANDLLTQTPPDRREGVGAFELSIMFDARGLPEVCVVARAASAPPEEAAPTLSLDAFLEPAPPQDLRRRRCSLSMGIWELDRFESDRLPVLQEMMAERCEKPWAKIEQETENGGVTFYTIRLKTKSSESVHIKRYKEFQTFDRLMRSQSKLGEALPQLPDSGLMGFRHAFGVGNFNERRREGLQQYLESLMDVVDEKDLQLLLENRTASFLAPSTASFA